VRAAVHHAVEELLAEGPSEALTMPVIAARAGVHPTTVYRRWASLGDLLGEVATSRFSGDIVVPDTGSLRGDLLRMGESICAHASAHASTIRAVLVEVSRSAELNDMMHRQFLDQRKALMKHVLAQAVDRGEIDASAITDDLWDVLPGYLIYRSILTGRSPSSSTVADLVDDVLIPSLTRGGT
jgi:AcrR family transcriptional regulator